MRVLVCGGRDLNAADVWNWLETFGRQDAAEASRSNSRAKIECIIHGAARGADEGAASWAHADGTRALAFPADWKKHGKAAGPIRNARMLREGKPDVVIAFPGGRGTANMVSLAEDAGIPIVRPVIGPSLPSTLTGAR